MSHLQLDQRPELKAPIAVVAFGGWGDAANAATNAARFFARRLGARRFASIDPEPFYVSTATPPIVRLDFRGQRQISWPSNEFLYARNPTGQHDFVVSVGVEPNLRWRTFASIYRDLFVDLGVDLVVSLGALIADVLHDEPARVIGSTPDPSMTQRLNLEPSRYEGPTGITGTLHTLLQASRIPAASLWASVPPYITTTQSPPATLGLVQRLRQLVDIPIDVSELESASKRFVAQVDQAIAGNEELSEYVRRVRALRAELASEDEGAAGLPEGKDLLGDIERFLRDNRADD
ncbi:MAG: filament polymerization regulator ParJ [Dehalococcoidia bacterium]